MLLHFEGDFNLQQHCFLRTQDICVNFTRVVFPIFTRSSVNHYKKNLCRKRIYTLTQQRECIFKSVFSGNCSRLEQISVLKTVEFPGGFAVDRGKFLRRKKLHFYTVGPANFALADRPAFAPGAIRAQIFVNMSVCVNNHFLILQKYLNGCSMMYLILLCEHRRSMPYCRVWLLP